MKFLLPVFAMLLSPMCFADTKAVEIPTPVLSMMASSNYQLALAQAKKAIDESPERLDSSRITVLGFESSDEKFGQGPVSVILGAPNKMWPTCIFKIGKVTGDSRWFPDGINGLMVSDVSFQAQKPEGFRDCR